MDIIIYLIIIGAIISISFIAIFFWCINNDQFDDLKGSANRILADDDYIIKYNKKNSDKK